MSLIYPPLIYLGGRMKVDYYENFGWDLMELSDRQKQHIVHGLEMIMNEFPAKASQLNKDKISQEDIVMLAEIEAMHKVLTAY